MMMPFQRAGPQGLEPGPDDKTGKRLGEDFILKEAEEELRMASFLKWALQEKGRPGLIVRKKAVRGLVKLRGRVRPWSSVEKKQLQLRGF